MALEVKQIGAGSVNASVTDSELLNGSGFTSNAVASGKALIVKNIRLVNTHSTTAINVTLNANIGGTNRKVSPAEVSLAPKQMYMDDQEITLETGNKLRLTTGSGGGPVDFVISGIMRDA